MAEAKAKTKKVVMVVEISGTRDGADWPKIGQELETTPEEADDLVAQKYAVTPKRWAELREKRG